MVLVLSPSSPSPTRLCHPTGQYRTGSRAYGIDGKGSTDPGRLRLNRELDGTFKTGSDLQLVGQYAGQADLLNGLFGKDFGVQIPTRPGQGPQVFGIEPILQTGLGRTASFPSTEETAEGIVFVVATGSVAPVQLTDDLLVFIDQGRSRRATLRRSNVPIGYDQVIAVGDVVVIAFPGSEVGGI